jgi:hypothetical protein
MTCPTGLLFFLVCLDGPSLFIGGTQAKSKASLSLTWFTGKAKQAAIGTQLSNPQFHAIDFEFINKTGSVAYLSRARLRENKKRFPIPKDAAKEISGGWHELKFQQPGTALLTEHECILQTNKSITTNIAISRPMDNAFYSYRPSWVWLRRRFRRPKYFLLQYTVVVGEKKYSVETVY